MKKQLQLASFIIPSILLVLLFSPLIFTQEGNLTPVGIPFEGRIEVFPTAPKFYKIDITDLPEDVDLSISVISNKGSSPKIFVSKKEEVQYPTDTSIADYSSTNSDGNIIFIGSKDLIGVANLYVGLSCNSNRCEADFTVDYSKEFELSADGSRHIETSGSLGGASSAVVRLNIPDVADAERIVIHVDAIPNNNEKPPELSVFINLGENIPFTSHAENIPRTSWFEGKTIVIYKNTNTFCTNCLYTMSLKFNEYSTIAIQATVFTENTELSSEAILDGVRTEKSNTYSVSLPVERKDQDLVIDVNPQQGFPTVYINCDIKPDFIAEYYWMYKIHKPQEIVVTSREHSKCQTGKFYLVVYGNDASVYSIKVMAKKDNKLFVGKDSPVLGDIFPNETVSYEIFVPLFSAEKVLVELQTKAKLKMDVINCRFPTDCPGLLPAGLDYKYQVDSGSNISLSPPDFKFNLEETPSGKLATIDPHAEGCYPILIQDPQFMEDPMPVCAYKISLFSNNIFPEEYTLKADTEGHQWLFVGIPKLASVVKDEYAYFILNIPHKDAAIVNIQLTKFSGNVDIYVSKVQKYPKIDTDATKFSHEGLIIFQNEPDLSGTYYISVFGLETSSFSLSSTVLTSSNKSEDYAQTLTAGTPQKGVILPKHEHPSRFYKFTLDLDDKWEGSLNIDVTTTRGSVLVAINNNDLVPLPNEHIWKAVNQKIKILSSDPSFSRKGTYYIGVFVDWSKVTGDDIPFNIMYYLKETVKQDSEGGKTTPNQLVNLQHLFLSPLTPFHRTISKNEVDYFEAFILPRDIGITVFKQADSGDVDLYLSLDQDNEYPSEKAFTYSTKTTHKDSIALSKEDLEKACSPQSTRLCTFYVSVVPKSDQNEVSYSLTMKREYASSPTTPLTPLEDGRQLQFTTPPEGTPSLFSFSTVPFKPAVVTVSCPEKDIAIYAKLKVVEVGSNVRPNIEIPTPESYDFNSKNQLVSSVGLAYLNIPAQLDLKHAIVSLAVYFKDGSSASSVGSTTFTILVSSKMTHIYTGQPYYGAVAKGQYMYYYLNVFRPSCTLLISMTTLDDGDPDLIVSTSTEKPPTIDSHQFASISKQRTELLELNELDVYPLTSMEGTWVIGVYGRTASTFTLTVLFEDQKMVQLKQSVPFEMYLKEGSSMYFKYYHEKADSIEVRVDQISGDVTGYITKVSGDMDLVSHLPNKTYNIWSVKSPSNSILNIPVEDPNACTECLYLVTLEAKQASKLSITVSEGVKFVQIQNGLRYSDQLAPSANKVYKFASPNEDEIFLSVSMKGPQLTVFASHNPTVNQSNYVWAMETTSSNPSHTINLQKIDYDQFPQQRAIWDGQREVPSERNSFYFFFENPSIAPITYSYIVTTKSTSPIIKAGEKHTMTITSGESTSLLYYCSQDDQVLKISIEFTVERDMDSGVDNEFERSLKRGLPVSASFWGEKVTAGSGQEATLIKEYVMRGNTEDQGTHRLYHVRQAFTTVGKKGKFSFEIDNPFFSELNVDVMVYSSEFGILSLEQNSQHSSSLIEGVSETYEIYIGNLGAWYLWVQSCTGDLRVRIGERPESFENSPHVFNVASGNQYTFRQMTGADPIRYVRIEKTGNKDSQFIMSSSFFKQKYYYSYDPEGEIPAIQADYMYQSLNSQLNLKFGNIKIVGYDPSDEIIYHTKVCPYKESDPDGPENLCKIYEECKLHQQKYLLSGQQPLDLKFERMLPGKYYVQVTADIQHNGKLIKFIPYKTQMVNISEPLSAKIADMMGIIILILVVLFVAVFVCYKCYGKFKQLGDERGFELPVFGQKKGYGFLGDESGPN